MKGNFGGILGSSYYLPPAMDLKAFATATGMPDTQRDLYLHTHGLQQVHVARAKEGPAEMSIKAVRNLLQEYEIDPLRVDAVILYHTMWLLSLEPRTLVGELQQALGLKRACGFSVGGQHCASSLAALRTAQNMIAAGSAENVVLVGIDSFLGSLNREIPGTTLQGEGASAALVQAGCNRNRILSIATHVDGSFYKGITATEREWEKFNLTYYIAGTRLIRQALKKLSLSLDDVALIIPHNTNLSSCEKIRSILSFSPEKVFTDNIRQCGHICSSDLVINLTDAVRAGKLQKGNFYLMFTVGLGAAWSCAILQH
jgi:3-oxoacyl-[acyl-carrier-protein] synthase III